MIYHSAMIRLASAVSMVFALALGGVAGTGIAHAGPLPPCTFTLSPPVVGPGGVTATAELAGCGPAAGPVLTVACLQPVGADTVIQCNQGRGSDPAQVSVAYQPGTTYIATGRGCAAWAGQSPAPDCQILGPLTATL